MAMFQSDSFLISATKDTLERFLSKPSNLKTILPEDRISNWQETDNGCSFKIKGLADIHLKLAEKEVESVIYASASEKPFPFKLVVELKDEGDETSIEAKFDADVNSFMGAMLKTPLVNFLNALGEAIKKRFDAA